VSIRYLSTTSVATKTVFRGALDTQKQSSRKLIFPVIIYPGLPSADSPVLPAMKLAY